MSLPTRYRWRICALLFLATAINYMDRQVIGLLKPMLEKDLGWSEIDYSHIVFWFQCAYASGYLFAGRMIDRMGVRWGLGLAIGVWSLFTMGHAFVRSVAGFCLMRFGLGLSEGGNFPGAIKAVSEWFPRRERALATGIFNAGSSLGAMIAPLFVPWIAVKFGWPVAFIFTGVLGLTLVAAWLPLYRTPDQVAKISPEELAHIRSDPPEEPQPRTSWLGLFKFRVTWGYTIAMLMTSPVWGFYLFWIPDYLNKTHHVSLLHLGGPLVVIYLMSDIGSVAGGWLALFLIKRGLQVRAARLISLLICALLVTPLFLIPNVSNLWICVLMIGLAAAAHQGWSSNLYTLVSDVMPKHSVASVVGIGGMAAGVVTMFVAQAIGYILEWTHSYSALFMVASSTYLVAVAILATLLGLPGRKAQAV